MMKKKHGAGKIKKRMEIVVENPENPTDMTDADCSDKSARLWSILCESNAGKSSS